MLGFDVFVSYALFTIISHTIFEHNKKMLCLICKLKFKDSTKNNANGSPVFTDSWQNGHITIAFFLLLSLQSNKSISVSCKDNSRNQTW